jgi:Flp pilus assembly protein TadB
MPVSLHSSAVDRQELSAIMRDYLALERARVYRRLFVRRFGLLAAAVGVAGIGFHWLPPAGSWVSMAICLVAPLWAWIAERRCDRRLTRRLDEVPAPHGSRLVRKS